MVATMVAIIEAKDNNHAVGAGMQQAKEYTEILDIRAGSFAYQELVEMAEARIAQMDSLYANSSLPEKPDLDKINQVLIQVRKEFYKSI